ncbi:MAG: alanine racemase [Chromatiales bacterium]|jgi:alanine racemase
MILAGKPLARINLAALRHNLERARQLAPGSKQMAVIKANAYGHGVVQVAKALDRADMLAVARIDEAVQLREAGIDKPLAVLEGFFDPDEIRLALQYELQAVIHQSYQIDLLQQFADQHSGKLQLWLKIDTGMHRLGIPPGQVHAAYEKLWQLEVVDSLSLMTHLANADDVNDEASQLQIKVFKNAIAGLTGEQSIANSAGIVAWPDARSDWVRPGIMLYGSSPLLHSNAVDHQLQPVMTLSSQLIAINQLNKGDCVGYGGSWCCPQDMPVGVVSIGYGDGYPRHAPSGTPVLVNGQRCPLVGRVSMDMVTVDLLGVSAQIGDEVILWGDGLPVDEIATAAGTISYELLCGVTSRVQFVYSDNGD